MLTLVAVKNRPDEDASPEHGHAKCRGGGNAANHRQRDSAGRRPKGRRPDPSHLVEVCFQPRDQHQENHADVCEVIQEPQQRHRRTTGGLGGQCREHGPREHVQDRRPQQQADQQFAEYSRLSDSNGGGTRELCGGDHQREQQQDLKEVGHGLGSQRLSLARSILRWNNSDEYGFCTANERHDCLLKNGPDTFPVAVPSHGYPNLSNGRADAA